MLIRDRFNTAALDNFFYAANQQKSIKAKDALSNKAVFYKFSKLAALSLIQAAAVEVQLRGYWESSASAISFALCNLYILVSCGMSSEKLKQVNEPQNCKMKRNFYIFSSLVCLILYWYCNEKFCLGHLWELKGKEGVEEGLVVAKRV